jgi:glycosylphosphatidylinositol transamidase (GPIT) subunit GPI8
MGKEGATWESVLDLSLVGTTSPQNLNNWKILIIFLLFLFLYQMIQQVLFFYLKDHVVKRRIIFPSAAFK